MSDLNQGGWDRPDPNGPAWCTKTDYYMGSYQLWRNRQTGTYPSRPEKPPSLKRRCRWIRSIIFAVAAVLFAIGGLYDHITHKYSPTPSLVIAIVSGSIAVLSALMAVTTSVPKPPSRAYPDT